MANAEITENKAIITFQVPIEMQEQYDIYTQELLEDGAFIVDDISETIEKEYITGEIEISFHKDMYDLETNTVFMEDIKHNLTGLEKRISLYSI